MSGLAKATLQEIKSDRSGTPMGAPVEVQFNPASLKLTMNNHVEGGRSRGRQARQFVGRSSTELSFDLVFDTADEAGNGGERSVRERTALVEKFVLPKGNGSQKQTPPKVRFHWGNLTVDGVISNLSIDFELFSSEGIPLRAKMGVTIKEQDPKYQYLESGPGANREGGSVGGSSPTAPTGAGGLALAGGPPGLVPSEAADRTEVTIDGESVAEFAARVGVDPAAWRSVGAGIEDTLALPGGIDLPFSSTLTASRGVTARTGVEVGVSASVEASLGLEFSPRESTSAGLALAAAGGVRAALNAASTAAANGAVVAARSSFQSPQPTDPGAFGAGPARGAGPSSTPHIRAPLARVAAPPSTIAAIGSAPSSVPGAASRALQLDTRSSSFGYGVPLRPLVRGAAAERSAVVGGAVSVRPHHQPIDHAAPYHPTTPPWQQLPPTDRARHEADRAQAARHPRHPCSCHGLRNCRGGKQ